MNASAPDKPPEGREEINVAIGPPIVGAILTALIGWSFYVGEIQFAMLTMALLVVLALGAASINKK